MSSEFRVIPDDFIILFNEESTVFGSTPELKIALEELQTAKKTYANDEEILAAIQEKNKVLHKRFQWAFDHATNATKNLTEPTKNFIKEQVTKLRSLRPADGEAWDQERVSKFAKEAYAKYNELSESERQDFAGADNFKLGESDAVAKLWDHFANIDERMKLLSAYIDLFTYDE
ncbi:hypothetical protein L596_025301 [Steinernema carpocapsae]|uniref:Uncharacterized protein n=1 Tax=Steinernema carpocapsae TaxID=34508 RepID=A0A4U5M7K4_STECR|nr:hypothetical protein L596_025301 [Steinernema carpocapsae]